VIAILQLLAIAWLPGAVLFRAPAGDRARRASLDPEERLFWAVILSLTVSLAIVLGLAYLGRYTLARLVVTDLLITFAIAAVSRFDLRLGSTTRVPRATIVLPLLLIGLGIWRFFPPAEYVIGGKDPGVYMNEGVQIAQRGTFLYEDPVVASVPPFARDLFFPSHGRDDYYSTRFMGFHILDPASGLVVGQFPHLFPASVAVAYGLDGLTGVRRTTAWWAILGLLAVYFFATRVFGRAVAFGAAGLLSLTLVEVWFARYPNTEMMMQALLFAALLGLVHAHEDGDQFFGPIAGVLLGLMLFVRIDAALAIVAAVTSVMLLTMTGRRLDWGFLTAVTATTATGIAYTLGPMRAYAARPIVFLSNLQAWHYGAIAAGAVIVLIGLRLSATYPSIRERVRSWVPPALALALTIAAIYALYFRTPGGRLAEHDAYALRTFAQFYLTIPALLAALLGFALSARHAFWRAPAFYLVTAAFSLFFFYKIHIVPDHFWMARRFVAVIVPAALIFASVAALGARGGPGVLRIPRLAVGLVFMVLIGRAYVRAAEPILPHVEYAGVIPHLERLAGAIGDRDLLIVESRNAATDVHTLALPLAYIYARHVLVLDSPVPDKGTFAAFLEWARQHYTRVLFLGAGGTDLLSRAWDVRVVQTERFQLPEYDAPLNEFPRYARAKQFDYTIYEFIAPSEEAVAEAFDLDVGTRDDLNVLRFYAKEETEGRTFRWSQDVSYIVVPALEPTARTITLWMSDGGRPASAGNAEVTIAIADRRFGTVDVDTGFRSYEVPIPPEVVRDAAGRGPVRIQLRTSVWKPEEVLGTTDDRDLGVMVDRVTVK
jgi:hypothetical protein